MTRNIRKKMKLIDRSRVISPSAIPQGSPGGTDLEHYAVSLRHSVASLLRATTRHYNVAYITLCQPCYNRSTSAVGCHKLSHARGDLTLCQ